MAMQLGWHDTQLMRLEARIALLETEAVPAADPEPTPPSPLEQIDVEPTSGSAGSDPEPDTWTAGGGRHETPQATPQTRPANPKPWWRRR
jgi:hypothetical protein